jgi:hypothetical protein
MQTYSILIRRAIIRDAKHLTGFMTILVASSERARETGFSLPSQIAWALSAKSHYPFLELQTIPFWS